MIKDYELLGNTNFLHTKRFVIWGVGKCGKVLAKRMYHHTKELVFVDSDKEKEGSYQGIPIQNPKKIKEYAADEIAIVISSDSLRVQESILADIMAWSYWHIDIYTKYAVESALYFEECNSEELHEDNEEDVCVLKNKIEEQKMTIQKINGWCRTLRQLVFSTISDHVVYVYQCKKVGSVSLTRSINITGAYAVHIHSFAAFELEDIFIRNMIRKTSGKVISVVRDPVARQISLLWHYLGENGDHFLKNYRSLADLEKRFYSIPNAEDEFEWFGADGEFAKVLGINVYEYPFDCERGYSIIEKEGISLLLLKLEKMNSLETVIRDFLGLDSFRLVNDNLAREKGYRYAYENYLENVRIPCDFIDHYYRESMYMDHFYTREEKDIFYEKWKDATINVGDRRGDE